MSISRHQRQNLKLCAPSAPPTRSLHWPIAMVCAGVLLTGVGMIGLSPASVLNALAAFGSYRTASDIAYAPGARHALDVYGQNRGGASAPVVVFFYGGNWQDGEKSTYRFVAEALASRGLVAVVPDYRVYPEVRFPGFIEDGARVVRWVHDHAAEFGGDPGRLVLMGHSAGAYIAAMLTYDRRWLAAVNLDPDRDVRGLVGLAGPYDFLPLRKPVFKSIFGPDDRLAATQPINFVEGDAPPAFLAAGRDDDIVDPGNTTRLGRRIGEKNGVATLKLYDGVGHRLLVGAFAAPLRRLVPVLRDTVGFIDSVTSTADTAAPRASVSAPR